MEQAVVMQDKVKMNSVEKLMAENAELRETIAIALNKPLLKELANSIKEIENGDFLREDEFNKRLGVEF